MMKIGLLTIIFIICTGCDIARPFWPNRTTAELAIRQSAKFQQETKLLFEVGQFEALLPDVCHNFSIAPGRLSEIDELRRQRKLQFTPFGNQMPPYGFASVGTYQLEMTKFLIDH